MLENCCFEIPFPLNVILYVTKLTKQIVTRLLFVVHTLQHLLTLFSYQSARAMNITRGKLSA